MQEGVRLYFRCEAHQTKPLTNVGSQFTLALIAISYQVCVHGAYVHEDLFLVQVTTHTC